MEPKPSCFCHFLVEKTPLARERSHLRSENVVFYRTLFCQVAPFAGGSALHARIPDSVGGFKIEDFKYHVNYCANCDPMLQFFDSVGYPGNRPGLSPGKEATSAPKMSCFTVHFFARLHRLRAAAPYKSESSIVLTVSGGGGREANRTDKTRHFVP